MNWTGGRLRRQSHNRPDSLLRIQKQHFAKERLKKRESNNKNAAILHLRSMSNLRDIDSNGPFHHSTGNDNISWATRQTQHTSSQICTPFDITHGSQSNQAGLDSANGSVIRPNSNAQEGTSLSYIDNIKQRILLKDDWVGLSPTRPVQVKFVPIEEKERIGKRRKLPMAGEILTGAMVGRFILEDEPSLSLGDQWYPRMNTEPGSNIDIRIHTAEMPLGISENLRSPIRTNSSDPLLLDDSIDGELGERHVPVNREPSVEPDEQQRFLQSQKGQRENKTRGSSELLTDQSSPMPVIHRFTLDDQILAEKERSLELNNSTSTRQQLSPLNLPGNRFSGNGFEEPDEQLRFSLAAKADDIFSENTGSSDLLPQTQKISRQLPPQPFSKNPVFSTPFRTTRDTRVLDHKTFHLKLPSQCPQEEVSFFGQSVPISCVPDEENKNDNNCEPVVQAFTTAPNEDEYFSDSPPRIPVSRIEETMDKPENPDQSPEKPTPSFRFLTHWIPHHNEQRLTYAEERSPTNIGTSPFVVVASRASSPFSRPRKALLAPNKHFSGVSRQSIEHEELDVPPYFNTPFHR